MLLKLLLADWNFDPGIILGLSMLTAGYYLAVGPLRKQLNWGPPVSAIRQAAFYSGLLVVALALISPLDELADQSLFSAHMLQHMLLTFAGPPLWLIGLPGWLVDRLLPAAWLKRAWQALTMPIIAFLVFNGCMWAWHIPRLYDAALGYEPLHIIEHLMFMGSALIGWWPALGPHYRLADELPARVLPEPLQALYLFASTLPCTALAAILTLSARPLYPFYSMTTLQYGLSPLGDQQLGGLLMWLPGDMIFMLAILIILGLWLNESSRTGNRNLIT